MRDVIDEFITTNKTNNYNCSLLEMVRNNISALLAFVYWVSSVITRLNHYSLVFPNIESKTPGNVLLSTLDEIFMIFCTFY